MKHKKNLIILFVIIAIGIYGFSVINSGSSENFSIEVDLSKPRSIVFPCEVSIVGDNGEKGFRIPPKVGRGWRGEAGGSATYKFYVPADDKYTIWANCLWFDVCANAVFIQIDDMDKAILGNDPLYNQWHWVRGLDIKLKKGTHSLTLSNHSDHISIEKFVFINNQSQSPDNSKLVFSDIFYDGFDGCDQGNFSSWKKISGNWMVLDPANNACMVDNVLVGDCNETNFIIYPNDSWQQYCLDISVKSEEINSENAAIGICFGLTDKDNFHILKILPKQNGQSEASLINIKGSKETLIASFKCNWKTDSFNQIEIKSQSDKVKIHLNGKLIFEQDITQPIIGGIGLSLESKIKAYFDNIHIRKIINKIYP